MHFDFSTMDRKKYVYIIELLNNKKSNINEIRKYILSHNDQNNPDDYFENFLDIVIDCYNNYYLNDDYYYNGYWSSNKSENKLPWINKDGKKFYDEYPRTMKLKMNIKNIKSICRYNDVCSYLINKNQSFNVSTQEVILLEILRYLKDPEKDMNCIYSDIIKKFQKYFDECRSSDDKVILCYLMKIIDDYNNFYLNDEFYYGGRWYDEEWIKDGEEPILHRYPQI